MVTFIVLTRLSPEAVRSPRALEQLERKAMERVRKECPIYGTECRSSRPSARL
jgi:hypothetical protein